jgi:membrane protein
MSFFLEPAHLAQYILGYLALTLGNNMVKKVFFGKESIFITIVLILTWSGNAIVGSLILWSIYVIYYKTTLLKKSLIFATVIIAAIISFSYIVSTEKGEKLLDRQEELSMDQARISSGTLRIFRGFFVYSKMPFDEQLLGVGTGYTPQVIDQNPYAWMFDANEYYINSAQTLLIGTGIFGTTIFLIFLIKLTRCKSPYPKLFIALLITLMLIESLYCSGRMLIYLTIAMYTYYHSIRTVKNKPICKHLKLENI